MTSLVTPPIGTVTLLFTDIEGSTQLLHRMGERYSAALEAHREILRQSFAASNGYEVDTQGDAFFVAFARAHDALECVVEAQRALHEYSWPDGEALRVRMALHTGEPAITRNGAQSGYVGVDLHRGARIMSAGYGGQVLLSQTTQILVQDHLSDGVALRDMGEHRLKDLAHPERLYQLVVAGLPHEFPPLKSLNNRPNNLPPQATSLVGREDEVAAACAVLRRHDARLLTFTGTGGTGKTRLALRVAQHLLEDCDDGVFFVDLAPLSDYNLVLSSIAQTLGVSETTGQSILATTKEYLRDKNLLLVLDNFEQVVGAAKQVAELLGACPQLRVLVTSRVALRISGEREMAIPPLSIPRRKPPPTLEQMSQYGAVQLFISRAQSVKADFDVTAENAPAIAEICARLDGLPLAIELAAARVKLLSPQAMLSRLDNRLKLLTGGARTRRILWPLSKRFRRCFQ